MRALFAHDAYQQQFTANIVRITDVGIALDATCFYATSGGQPFDTGTLNGIPVIDVVKDAEYGIIHKIAPEHLSAFADGQNVDGVIDWDRRYKHMRMHTAMHLLSSLVRGDVTGGAVGYDKSRLDFNIETHQYDPAELTDAMQKLVDQNLPVVVSIITEAELDANPALVRTLSVKPPRGTGTIRMITIGDETSPVDRQPCGGTHGRSTIEIGRIAIPKIENKGKQNRRFSLTLDVTI